MRRTLGENEARYWADKVRACVCVRVCVRMRVRVRVRVWLLCVCWRPASISRFLAYVFVLPPQRLTRECCGPLLRQRIALHACCSLVS